MKTLVIHQGIVDQPSQWLNAGYMFITASLFLMFPPLGLLVSFGLLWKVLVLRFWTWVYTEDSVIERKGVFDVSTDEIQYFRIKDVQLEEPFLYRLVGLSKIYVHTSDRTRPLLVIDGVYDGQSKRDMIKKMSMTHRRREGVKEVDFR